MSGPRITSIHDTPMIVRDGADREWQHAACLSIAEGAPGWDGDFGDRASEAMRAVQNLRREMRLLAEERDTARAERGVLRAALADAQRMIDVARAERDAARADLDALRAAAREHLDADDACAASVGRHTDWNIASGLRLSARLALRRLIDERAGHLPLPGETQQTPLPSAERDALRADLLAARAAWAALRDAARAVLDADHECAATVDVYEDTAGIEEDGPVECAQDRRIAAFAALRRLIDGGTP